MSPVVLLARIVLAAIFLVAALGKLRDGAGTRQAMRDFGAPAALAGTLALVLPALELTAAALLLIDATAVAGAVVSLVLLAVFSIAVARVLARGEAPDCHCFGQISSQPASWRTLARNAVLAALAVLVLVAGPDEGWGAVSSGALPWLLVAVAALLVLGVVAWALISAIRSHGRLLLRVERLEATLARAGLAVDDDPLAGFAVDHHEPPMPAPAFSAPAAAGRRAQPRRPPRPGKPRARAVHLRGLRAVPRAAAGRREVAA